MLLDLLSLRTFSSVWYWIAVAVTWTQASQRPMGVPYDMVWRAGTDAGAGADLDAVARAFARRRLALLTAGGGLLVALISAALSGLVVLAAAYRLELAQGLALIAVPRAFVAWLEVRAARAIDAGGAPVRQLRRLRMATNAVGIAALFVTAAWGTYANLIVRVL